MTDKDKLSKLGVGAMIQMLSSNEDSVNAFQTALGKVIKRVWLDDDAKEDGALCFEFDDNSGLLLFDCARSCCESRYMHTDDDLAPFVGATFLGVEIRDGPVEVEDDWGGTKETQFMDVKTSKGMFQVCTYNEHNGYYGGILIQAESS